MAYEYRKLSADERLAVLEKRRAHGHPLHAPPHPYALAGRFLITAANYEHTAIMAAVERRTDFEDRMLSENNGAGSAVLAWVVLPNHYHVLGETETLLKVGAALKLLHGRTSREWNAEDGQTGVRRVWYHYRDRRIRNEAHLFRSLNYIHHNPAKHGYVADPYKWPWSSLHNYLDAHGREWLRAQWRNHAPPGDFGNGWDD